MKLESLENSKLWSRYKEAMDDLCVDPDDLSRSRAVNRIEEEIVRRIRAAGGERVAYRRAQEA